MLCSTVRRDSWSQWAGDEGSGAGSGGHPEPRPRHGESSCSQGAGPAPPAAQPAPQSQQQAGASVFLAPWPEIVNYFGTWKHMVFPQCSARGIIKLRVKLVSLD